MSLGYLHERKRRPRTSGGVSYRPFAPRLCVSVPLVPVVRTSLPLRVAPHLAFDVQVRFGYRLQIDPGLAAVGTLHLITQRVIAAGESLKGLLHFCAAGAPLLDGAAKLVRPIRQLAGPSKPGAHRARSGQTH